MKYSYYICHDQFTGDYLYRICGKCAQFRSIEHYDIWLRSHLPIKRIKEKYKKITQKEAFLLLL